MGIRSRLDYDLGKLRRKLSNKTPGEIRKIVSDFLENRSKADLDYYKTQGIVSHAEFSQQVNRKMSTLEPPPSRPTTKSRKSKGPSPTRLRLEAAERRDASVRRWLNWYQNGTKLRAKGGPKPPTPKQEN